MAVFDLVVLGVIVVGVITGARRGLAWQVAPIVSLVLGYIVAYPMSKELAPWFGDSEPTNQFVALMVLYFGVSFGVYMVARTLRGAIDQFKLTAFDHHLGAIFGGLKAALFSLVVVFFLVGMSTKARNTILPTKTGYVAGVALDKLEAVLPPTMREKLGPYLAKVDFDSPPTPDWAEPASVRTPGGFNQPGSPLARSVDGQISEWSDKAKQAINDFDTAAKAFTPTGDRSPSDSNRTNPPGGNPAAGPVSKFLAPAARLADQYAPRETR